MNVRTVATLLSIWYVGVSYAAPGDRDWTYYIYDASDHLNNFIEDNTTKMRAFFENQKSKVENAVNIGFGNVVQVKDTVNNFFEDQRRKLSADINSYVESVKKSGQSAALYVPKPSDDDARLDNPDVALSVPAIISRNGYPCETHTVMSQGYLLSVHRVPRGAGGGAAGGGATPSRTVLLQHGLFASSADWVLNGPGRALAYVLADAGYDVWMPNIRGNRYSKEHAWLKSDCKAYWNFSWHDIAMHDVPEIIDYIIMTKGSGTKISYIGHSMGTTILFAMLTLRPEYNDILRAGIALAPEVFLSNMKSPLKSFAPLASNMAYMETLYGSHEFFPKNSLLSNVFRACETETMDDLVCKNMLFSICGSNESQFNRSLLPIFMAHFGTGTSWKTIVHFAQEVVSGRFQMFDYGPSHNRVLYGSDEAPDYDLSKVTLPLTLFWSKNDLLSDERDVQTLSARLPPSTTELCLVPHPEFNHLDYIWAIDAPTLVNRKLLDVLQKNEQNEFNIRFTLRT